jgi:hypothetical protein
MSPVFFPRPLCISVHSFQPSLVKVLRRLTQLTSPACVNHFLTLRPPFVKQKRGSKLHKPTWKIFQSPTNLERTASGKSWTSCVWKRTRGSACILPLFVHNCSPSPQIHIRGLPFRGSKAKSELGQLCAFPRPLLLLEKRRASWYSELLFSSAVRWWCNVLEWPTTQCPGRLPQVKQWQTLISVWQVDLSCGLSNELLTVAEREKCEYLITGTTPALCSSEFEGSLRDEL